MTAWEEIVSVVLTNLKFEHYFCFPIESKLVFRFLGSCSELCGLEKSMVYLEDWRNAFSLEDLVLTLLGRS